VRVVEQVTGAGPNPTRTRTISLTPLLHRPARDHDQHLLGRVIDVIVQRSDGPTLWVTGLLIALADRHVRIPAPHFTVLGDAVEIDSVDGVDAPFERAPEDLLLDTDVLGRRLIDAQIARLVRARDIELRRCDGRWLVAGVDVEWGGWWHHLKGWLNHHRAHRSWDAVEPLTNTDEGPVVGHHHPALACLPVAQIADLLERASAAERSDILADLRGDPELSADVFEELDRDHAARLLAERPDTEIAELLARMSADDAAAELADRKLVRVRPEADAVHAALLMCSSPSSVRWSSRSPARLRWPARPGREVHRRTGRGRGTVGP
jgi:hypothetical protein